MKSKFGSKVTVGYLEITPGSGAKNSAETVDHENEYSNDLKVIDLESQGLKGTNERGTGDFQAKKNQIMPIDYNKKAMLEDVSVGDNDNSSPQKSFNKGEDGNSNPQSNEFPIL